MEAHVKEKRENIIGVAAGVVTSHIKLGAWSKLDEGRIEEQLHSILERRIELAEYTWHASIWFVGDTLNVDVAIAEDRYAFNKEIRRKYLEALAHGSAQREKMRAWKRAYQQYTRGKHVG